MMSSLAWGAQQANFLPSKGGSWVVGPFGTRGKGTVGKHDCGSLISSIQSEWMRQGDWLTLFQDHRFIFFLSRNPLEMMDYSSPISFSLFHFLSSIILRMHGNYWTGTTLLFLLLLLSIIRRTWCPFTCLDQWVFRICREMIRSRFKKAP